MFTYITIAGMLFEDQRGFHTNNNAARDAWGNLLHSDQRAMRVLDVLDEI